MARKKQWKDLGIASFIMLIAWLYGVDLGWDLQLMPNPLDFFQLFNGIDKWYYNFFHLSA